jgi:Na+-translocating ferredoxin:NAD+ oxidoreductase RnfD subunit
MPFAARMQWPRRDDPRWPFAALLTTYAVLGLTLLGFNRSPAQVAVVVVTGTLLDMFLTRWLKGQWVFPLSAYITCCSLALLLNHSHASPLLLVPVLLAIGSKQLLTFRGRHVFNPSMFGVSVSLLISNELITSAPAYQWVGGAGAGVALSLFIVGAACVFFIRKLGRWPLVASFLVFYMLQTGLRAWIMRHHLPPETLFLGTLTAPSFFIFTFYMITDPATSPSRPRDQVILAGAITLVDLLLHTRQSVYTFFYASLICASCRFLYLHLQAWRRGEWPAAALWGTRRVALLLGLVLAGGLSLAAARGGAAQPGFRMVRLPAEHTGIRVTMGNLLAEVDPGLAHVAKWLLSVGDAVAVGDYDGDGRLDLFLTNVLKRPEDRGALYRGLGDLRFSRVPLPPMDALTRSFPEAGLPSGATFVDLDADGDQDLLLAMSFGPSRLFRNQLRESGRADFVDASREVGLVDAPSISLSIAAFDFDRDAVLDLYLANAAAPLLRDYATPTPLNIFRLPRPQYEGDRRMFHFMHNGWHNSDNGGANVFYRGTRDGHLQRLDSAALGMPETHWSLAVATVDLNRDGFTDLYVANDFGPDDVYLNDGGAGLRRVTGRMFGEIGRDTYKGMNASVADFDRNGWLDVYVSNVHHALQAEGSLLWMLGPGRDRFWPRFRDEAAARGALNERRFGWGAAAGDLDLDGWPDIVQANGMVDDRLDRSPHPIANNDYWYVNHKIMQSGPEIHTYADRWGDLRGRTIYPNEARRAYLNRGADGPGEFVDVARAIGIDDPDNSRGVALADLDDDGDLDLVVTNQHGPPSIYRNDLRDAAQPDRGPAGFVGLLLEGDGKRTNRSAIGTRVELRLPGSKAPPQIREVSLAGGFSAQADPRLLFGLGDHRGAVEVTIHWYGAGAQEVTLAPGRYHQIRQNTR